MSSNPVIEVRDLAKSYRVFQRPQDRLKQMLFGRFGRKYYQEFWALSNISATIGRGETVGIIGRNGSGKSTFLQLLCGTLAPTSGSLSVKGRVAALLELGAGFNPEFTGMENVRLSAALLGLTNQQIDDRLASILDFAGIGDFIDQPVKVYSSGMYARLAFAVAAHADADILIVDEILAVGDAAFTQKCMRFIREFQTRGTLLFVSHSVESVLDLCARAIWLDGGVVRAMGDSKEIVHQYTASLFGEKDSGERFKIGGERKSAPASSAAVQDHRHQFLSQSNVRNDVEVFSFEKDGAWFGHRGATLTDVKLYDGSGADLPLLVGGESVVLSITAKVDRPIARPILGFFVKDSRGQFIFGDNTYLTYKDQPQPAAAGGTVCASFSFQMPYLPSGDYSVLASIAEGTQEEHIQHHWIDDALFFKVHSSHVAQGLVGIPIQSIELSIGTP